MFWGVGGGGEMAGVGELWGVKKKNPYCLECRANGPKLREPLWETYGEHLQAHPWSGAVNNLEPEQSLKLSVSSYPRGMAGSQVTMCVLHWKPFIVILPKAFRTSSRFTDAFGTSPYGTATASWPRNDLFDLMLTISSKHILLKTLTSSLWVNW